VSKILTRNCRNWLRVGMKVITIVTQLEGKADQPNYDSDSEGSVASLHETSSKPRWQQKLAKFLDHYAVVIFMTLVTIYALFFDDIRIAWFPKSSDDIFFGLTLFGMVCFAVEILLASVSVDDYFLGFFFWLDVISTISMIPDCGWIWDPLTGGGGTSATDLAKTSRAGRVTRVIRVIRLIRLIRIVKLYK